MSHSSSTGSASNGELTEFRPAGSRNFIRVGDVVAVAPSAPKRRDGFDAKVVRFDTDSSGAVVAVQVVGPRGFRTVRPERVRRRQQTRGGERVDRRI